jgi:hypothetical protein
VVTSRLTWAHQRSSEVRCEQETHGSALIPQGERARANAGVHGCAWACAGTGVESLLTVARPVAAARKASALVLQEGCARKQNRERGCACDGEGCGTYERQLPSLAQRPASLVVCAAARWWTRCSPLARRPGHQQMSGEAGPHLGGPWPKCRRR